MTRINLIDPSELTGKHLVAETREITRVFGLARKAQFDIIKGKRKLPTEYTLGTGHVLFFYNKLKFIALRYQSLVAEMQSRGYKPNKISTIVLMQGIDKSLYLDYHPTQAAIEINKQRISNRLQGK